MLKLGFENQSQKRSQGLTFSPLPETRSGKLLPLAISLFFIFFLQQEFWQRVAFSNTGKSCLNSLMDLFVVS